MQSRGSCLSAKGKSLHMPHLGKIKELIGLTSCFSSFSLKSAAPKGYSNVFIMVVFIATKSSSLGNGRTAIELTHFPIFFCNILNWSIRLPSVANATPRVSRPSFASTNSKTSHSLKSFLTERHLPIASTDSNL